MIASSTSCESLDYHGAYEQIHDRHSHRAPAKSAPPRFNLKLGTIQHSRSRR
jgi:hypothetical protein